MAIWYVFMHIDYEQGIFYTNNNSVSSYTIHFQTGAISVKSLSKGECVRYRVSISRNLKKTNSIGFLEVAWEKLYWRPTDAQLTGDRVLKYVSAYQKLEFLHKTRLFRTERPSFSTPNTTLHTASGQCLYLALYIIQSTPTVYAPRR